MAALAAFLLIPQHALAGPPNDDFDGAKVITTYPFSDTFYVPELTAASDDPTACIWPTDKTVWYKLTPTASQRVVFSTTAPGSIGIDLFTGSRGSLTAVACPRNGYQTRLAYDVSGGTTYYLMVSAPSGAQIDLTVSAEIAPSGPANDHFDGATQIGTSPFTNSLDTTDAIESIDDPTCHSSFMTNTVWYRWTAPGTRRVSISTTGSTYDPGVGVYTGTRGTLTQVGCQFWIRGNGPALEFNASAGTTYYLMVGTLTPQFGDGGLTLSFSAKGLSRISLGVSRTRVVYGQSVQLTGHITALSDTSGDTVSVYQRPSPGSVFRTLAGTTVADGEGNFSLTLTPDQTYWYEAEWVGDEQSLDAVSGKKVVEVKVRITGKLFRFYDSSGGYKLYRPGTAPLYVVTVAPIHRAEVGFRLQIRRDGAWRRFAATAFPLDEEGAVAVVLRRLPRGMPFRIKAKFASDGDHVGASTRWSYLKIVA